MQSPVQIKHKPSLKERNELQKLKLKPREELVEEVIQSKKDIQHLHEQLNNAFKSIDQLIKRVADLEGNKFYKFRKFIGLYLKRLRGSVKKGNKKNIFFTLFNYVFKRGGRIARIIFAKILKHIYLLVEIDRKSVV